MARSRSLPLHHEYPKYLSNPSLTSNSPGYYDTATYLSGGEPWYGDDDELNRSFPLRFLDSFKRDPNRHIIDPIIDREDQDSQDGVFNPHKAAIGTANSGLARKLKGRHLQMIAIGGSIGELGHYDATELAMEMRLTRIGTGLFVASGRALNAGGPASLLIAFSLIGIMLYCTVHALGEMAVLFPVAGSFSAYSTRFLDPAWGFAMGWK